MEQVVDNLTKSTAPILILAGATCLEWAIASHGMYESFLVYFIINKKSIMLIFF